MNNKLAEQRNKWLMENYQWKPGRWKKGAHVIHNDSDGNTSLCGAFINRKATPHHTEMKNPCRACLAVCRSLAEAEIPE